MSRAEAEAALRAATTNPSVEAISYAMTLFIADENALQSAPDKAVRWWLLSIATAYDAGRKSALTDLQRSGRPEPRR